MGILDTLGNLRDLYVSGKLTDEEYDAARVAVVTGHPERVQELFDRVNGTDRSAPSGND